MAKFVNVAKTSAIPPGEMKSFSIDGKRILVVNLAGTFFATQDVCTHDNGTLSDGEVIDGEIECPRHGGRFDPQTGAVRALPPMFPIKTFAVQVIGDDVQVNME